MYSNTFQKYLYSYSNTLVNDVFIVVFMNLESIPIRILFKVFAPCLSICQVNYFSLLAYMEYLYQNTFSPANIRDNLAGITAQFIVHNLDTSPFQHQQLQYFYKSTEINRPLQPRNHTYIDIDLLTSVISLCDAFPDSLVYKTLLLVAFFSFLRLSNLLPDTVQSFDPTRQLARGDVLFTSEGATLLIKWSKTLQSRTDIRTIPIPWLKIPHSAQLHPCTAFFKHNQVLLTNLFFEFPGTMVWFL